MAILDKVFIKYDSTRNKYWLQRGRETFFDEERKQRMWDTEEEAISWAITNLGVAPEFDPDDWPDMKKKEHKTEHDPNQPTLF